MINIIQSFKCLLVASLVLHAFSLSAWADNTIDLKTSISETAKKAGGGLCVSAGLEDNAQAVEIATSGHWLVHVIDTHKASVQKARDAFNSKKITGLGSAEMYKSLKQLPYRNNMATLLIVDADRLGDAAPAEKEILRVLTPKHGVAFVKRGDKWSKVSKPWPKEYGNWTHLYGMPNGNLFSNDTAVNVPNGIGWVGEGGKGQNNSTLVNDGVIVMADKPLKQTKGNKLPRRPDVQKKWGKGLSERFKDHASSGETHLVRDAFNGIPRYRLDARKQTVRLIAGDKFISCVLAPSERKKHYNDQRIYIMASYDLRTGKPFLEYTEGLSADQHQGVGGHTFDKIKQGKLKASNLFAAALGNLLVQSSGNEVVGLDVNTGKRLWTYKSDEMHSYQVAITEDGKDVYFGEGELPMQRVRFYGARKAKNIVRLNAKTGQVVWKASVPDVQGRKSSRDSKNMVMYKQVSQILPVVKEDKVFLCASDHHGWGADIAYVAALNMKDGSLAWLRGANRDGAKKAGVKLPKFRDMKTKEEREAYFKKYQSQIQKAVAVDNRDASNMAMLYRNGKIEYYGSYNIFLYDADTGFMSMRSQGNMGCQRSTATPNMTYIASYAFAKTVEHGEVSYDEVGFQHPHCGDGFVPSQGMWFTESSEKCLCVRHIWTQFSMVSRNTPDQLDEASRLEKAGEFPGKDKHVFSSIMPIEKTAKSPILSAWERGYYGPVNARDAIFHDDKGWSESLIVGKWTYKADLHAHRMVGFKDGQAVWSYQTGGRIPGQPVLHEGNLYFSSRDGYLYAVNAETGEPKWRFLAARNHHKIYFSGQLESLWPATNVVLHEGKIVVAAGIHNQADGGLYIWGLNPISGEVLWNSQVANGSRANSEGNHFHGHGKGKGRMQYAITLHFLGVVDNKISLQFEHKKGFGPQPPDGLASLFIDPRG